MKWTTIALFIYQLRDRAPTHLMWNAAHSCALRLGARYLDADIAMQRAQRRIEHAAWQSVSQFVLVVLSRAARASLPLPMCYHFLVCSCSPDQIRLSKSKIITGAAHPAA
jgi:hypothetical protein